ASNVVVVGRWPRFKGSYQGTSLLVPIAKSNRRGLAPEGSGPREIETARAKIYTVLVLRMTHHQRRTTRSYEHNYPEYFRSTSERAPREDRSANDGLQAGPDRSQR